MLFQTKEKGILIKSASGSATGVFHSLSGDKDFEFLVIVLDKDYQLLKILEFTWDEFLTIRETKEGRK